jgi:oligopeptide transport system substrate-binding protein
VEALIEEDPDRVLAMYEAGEIHWTGHAGGLLPRARMKELVARPDALLQPQLGTAWYHVNTRVAPLSDERVRRALTLALDRSELTDVLGPDGVPTTLFVPGGIPGYVSPDVAPADPDLARSLLADAGFPGGEGFPPIELAVDSRALHENVARRVAAIWKRELGVEVNVYTRSWAAHSEAVEAGTFQLARGGWQGDYPDPSNFLELLQGDHALNKTGWRAVGYDALVEEATQTEDPESRMRLLSKAEAVLIAEAPILPLFHFGSIMLLKPEVKGFVNNPLDIHLLRYLSIEN